ncbi:integrase core -containing domain protein, partial [Escherichia coli 174750]
MPALNSGHTIGHITAPHLIWLGHGELPFKVVRDSNMFMTT